MAKIKKIKLSGVTYDIEDAGAIHSFESLSGSASVATVASNLVSVYDKVNQANGVISSGSVAATVYNKAGVDAIHTELSTRIDNLESRGRYLSGWNCTTGKPDTEPTSKPYAYKAGDYYIVSAVGTTNYKPSGSEYSGAASTVVESGEVQVGDIYTYDGAGQNWVLTHTPVVQDTNQKVSAGAVTFAPNDTVDFVGSGIVSIAGNATGKTITISASHQDISGKQDKIAAAGSANKPVYFSAAGSVAVCNFTVDKSVPSDAKFTDTITTVDATPSGSGNVVTNITADASGKLTLTKGITALVAADISGKADKSYVDEQLDTKLDKTGDVVVDDNDHQFAVAYMSSDETKAVGLSISKDSSSQSVQIMNMTEDGEFGISVVNGANQKVELTANDNYIELTDSDAKLATAGSADTSIMTKGAVKAQISAASSGSHTHTLSGTISGEGSITIPTVSKTANKLVTTSIAKDVASKATAGTAKNFVTSAIKSASCSQSFNTDAIKSATCAQSFNTDAIKSASLTGTTTFVTGFASGSEAYHANYNTADECLELTIASIATAAVGISTSAATATPVSITTSAATKTAVSITTSAAATDSITPYTFADVNVATIASAVTLATGALSATGSGSDVTSTISIGTSQQAITVSASLSGSTGASGAHTHTLA